MKLTKSKDVFRKDGDYAIVRFENNDTTHIGWLVMVNGSLFLMSNCRVYAGSTIAKDLFNISRYSYYLTSERLSLGQVLRLYDFEMNGTTSITVFDEENADAFIRDKLVELFPDNCDVLEREICKDFSISIPVKPFLSSSCIDDAVKCKKLKDDVEVALDVKFFDIENESLFLNATTNWFAIEGTTNRLKDTIRTIQLPFYIAKDVETWRTLISNLRGRADAWDVSNANITVKVNSRFLTGEHNDEKIKKLLFFYNLLLAPTGVNDLIFGRCCRQRTSGEMLESVKLLGCEVLRDRGIKDKFLSEIKINQINERNSEIFCEGKWIVFKQGKSSLNLDRISSIIEWCELIIKYANHTPWCQMSMDDFYKFVGTQAKSEVLSKKLKGFL